MSKPSIFVNLLVLRTADLEASLTFYRTLGLELVEEQHGTGPVHYACVLDGLVLEIYPGKPGAAPDRKQAGATVIGFQIDDLDAMVVMLQSQSVIILTAPQISAWGKRAVVQDPDGRAIELNQPTPV
ncbi:MAG TPA: VOC family protein [Phototrophicaceae bacterium]|nr:VOC family protein [Phototrophicaceae bacterium]